MSRQTYMSIERGVCVVCGKQFDAGTLMIEKHPLSEASVVGWELCKADAQMHRLGFVALVECELDMTAHHSGETLPHDEVHRTGGIMHLTREAFIAIFKTASRPGLPCAYVPQGTLQKLQSIMRRELN